MQVSIRKTTAPEDIAICQQIRRIVFVEGQNVPEAEEIDGRDGKCTHYLLCIDGEPAATARLLRKGRTAKIQRVCVLNSLQGMGLGKRLIHYILADLRGFPGEIVLGAQEKVIPFYEKLGFRICGEVYMDANIPHRPMELA